MLGQKVGRKLYDFVNTVYLIYSGYYLYIESSAPRKMYDLARITTPQFSNSQGSSCLSFWYHMYGANVGNLTLYLQDGPTKKMVFKRQGNQVNLWLYYAATLRPISSKFQVRLFLCSWVFYGQRILGF